MPLMRRFTGLALAAIVLSGCGGGPVVNETLDPGVGRSQSALETPSPSESAQEASPAPLTTGAPANQPPPPLGEGVATGQPAWNSAAEQAAIRRAQEVMGAFTSTELISHQWQSRIKPMLTPRAQQAWSRADLKFFTATSVTGPATLDADRSNPYWIWATVPTNDGDYRVNLNRLGPGEPWLADMIRPLQVKK
jgi:hypothetical protein